VADRVLSIRRSVDRNRGGAALQRPVAGEGSYTRGTKLVLPAIPSMGEFVRPAKSQKSGWGCVYGDKRLAYRRPKTQPRPGSSRCRGNGFGRLHFSGKCVRQDLRITSGLRVTREQLVC
jgi:hypothetical protein